GRALAHHRQVPVLAVLEHGVRLPLAVFPGPDGLDEFPEVDFGIEVGGEVAAVAARVHVDDVDRFDFVEVRVHGVAPVSVDDAGIEAGTQDGGDACCTAGIATLPLEIGRAHA